MIEWQPAKPRPSVHVRKEALAKFLARAPEQLATRLALADQHLYLSQAEEARNVLDDVQDDVRSDPVWLTAYGRVARARRDDRTAEDCLQRAYDRGIQPAGVELAQLFNTQSRHDEAMVLSEAILAEAPHVHAAAVVWCKSLIATNQLDALWHWAWRRLESGQWDAVLPSALAYASMTSSKSDATQALVASESTLVITRNFAGAASAAELNKRLSSHPARSRFPTIYAGRGEGERIDQLLELGIEEAADLFGLIRDEVTRYITADLSQTEANEYTPGFPAAASIESWANICVGDGHESWHCHPGGWLSGVYYVDVPDAPMPDRGGQIEFGPLMLGTSNDLSAWPKTSLQPETDMLLLFPSYFGHRTYPTLLRDARVSIAFDVVPQPYQHG